MTSKIALILLSTLGALVALPAMAPAAMASDRLEQRLRFDEDAVLARLQSNGVNAVSVEAWNGLVRAYVQTSHGQVMQFFDPVTLNPVEG